MTEKVLVIGSGGREHALGEALSRDLNVRVFYAKGNPGTALDKRCQNTIIDGTKKENFSDVMDFVDDNKIDMIVVGPEQPLVDGLVGYCAAKDFTMVFGPTSGAAAIEADKFYSARVMAKANVPQASYFECSTAQQGLACIEEMCRSGSGVVLKARGLTGGKGVSVFDDAAAAKAALAEFMSKYPGDFLVSERLFGQEFSVFGISNGDTVTPLEMAVQDHKRLLDGDKGPNTGGMGAYCPVPIAPRDMVLHVAEKMMTPVVRKMREQGVDYKGFLYAGVMLTDQGPKVLEFNCRMGDPETQPLVRLVKGGLFEPLYHALEGKPVSIEFEPGSSVCVVLASQGYPEKPAKGYLIKGLDEAAKIEGVRIYHAGTGLNDQRQIVCNGGRVLGITGYSPLEGLTGLKEAQNRAYLAANIIQEQTRPFGNLVARRDIAEKAFA